jgi:hypothetical protein
MARILRRCFTRGAASVLRHTRAPVQQLRMVRWYDRPVVPGCRPLRGRPVPGRALQPHPRCAVLKHAIVLLVRGAERGKAKDPAAATDRSSGCCSGEGSCEAARAGGRASFCKQARSSPPSPCRRRSARPLRTRPWAGPSGASLVLTSKRRPDGHCYSKRRNNLGEGLTRSIRGQILQKKRAAEPPPR